MRRIRALTIAFATTWLSTSSLACKREHPQGRVDAGGEVAPVASSSADGATAEPNAAANDAGAHVDSGAPKANEAFRVTGPDGRIIKLRGSKLEIEEVSKIAAVYEMTEYTENKQDCSTEGVSALEQHKQRRFVLLYRESGLVSPYLVSCTTIPECQAIAAAVRKGTGASRPELAQGFDLVRGRRLSGAREEVGDWDFKEGCTNAFHGRAKLTWTDEQVTLELRGYGFDYQRDAACNREEMLGQAQGKGKGNAKGKGKGKGKAKPCNRLSVIRGKRVASLM